MTMRKSMRLSIATGAVALVSALLPVASASATTDDVLGIGTDRGGAIATFETQSRSVPASLRAGDGSYWIWGAGGIGGKTFSHYFRERSCHGATAVGKGTDRVTGVGGSRYAKAEVPSAVSGNKAYYHNC